MDGHVSDDVADLGSIVHESVGDRTLKIMECVGDADRLVRVAVD